MPIFSLSHSLGFHALTLAQAAASTAGQAPRNAFADMLPMLFFFGVIFYFMLIRPQQKRAKEQAALLSSIRSGDEVVVNGMHGIVANPRDAESKTALIKFAENTKIEVDKTAITSVVKPEGSAAKAVPVAKS